MPTAIYEFVVRSSHLPQNVSILWGFRTRFEMTDGTNSTMCYFSFYYLQILPFSITLSFACHDRFEIKQKDGDDAFSVLMYKLSQIVYHLGNYSYFIQSTSIFRSSNCFHWQAVSLSALVWCHFISR